MTPVSPQKSFPTDAGINWLLGQPRRKSVDGHLSRLVPPQGRQGIQFPVKEGGVESILEDRDGAIWITRSRVGGSRWVALPNRWKRSEVLRQGQERRQPRLFCDRPCPRQLGRHLVRMPDVMPLERKLDQPLHGRADGSSIR